MIIRLSLVAFMLLFAQAVCAKPLPPKLQPKGDEGKAEGEAADAVEAAVNRGLQWLARNQAADGRWKLDGAFKDKGISNDTAGTALGLLPFLKAGKTHKVLKDNPYAKHVEKGLQFLIRTQDRKTGKFPGDMYAHGLASIALCEAYSQTKDANLRAPAQFAINYIVKAQHEKGGWRYSPGQAGDTSVTGWQVTALVTAQKAGLNVPQLTLKKAQAFLDTVCNANDEGYGYTDVGSTPTNSAIGLFCRHLLQGWNDKNARWTKGIEKHVTPNAAAAARNQYFSYYATQVMSLRGGDAWKTWIEKMRDQLIKAQVGEQGDNYGSWPAAGDAFAQPGGRLMVTSLAVLNLEVYQRALQMKKDDDDER